MSALGAGVVAPLAFVSAPAIGGALGAWGTNLTGAAATSHGLAILGGGPLAAGGMGMAGGVSVVTATGSALGGALGATVTAAYAGDDKSFKIVKLRDGVGTPVIISSGFLTEATDDWGPWQRIIDERYGGHPVYRVFWGSKELKELGKFVATGGGQEALRRVAEGLARRSSRTASLGALGAVMTAKNIMTNPWTVAVQRAQQTGAILADLIARSDEGPYILVGHSLGARVMAVAAETLSGAPGNEALLADVHLLGAAIHRKWDWRPLHESVQGTVYNYWSCNDVILKILYRVAQGGQVAAGERGLDSKWANIKNRDRSRQVEGHSEYFTKAWLDRGGVSSL